MAQISNQAPGFITGSNASQTSSAIVSLIVGEAVLKNAPAGAQPGANWAGGYANIASTAKTVPANSGVYSGSLSSLGNMVAMDLSEGDYQIKVTTPGWVNIGYLEVDTYVPLRTWANLRVQAGQPSPIGVLAPYTSGYIREYWRDPTQATFGSNSAIPALTGVIPDNLTDSSGNPITDMQGNFIAYVDLQMQRLSGSNTWDNLYFMNAFSQALSWVLTTNDYLAALQNAEANTLSNFGSSNYADFVSQGFDKYKIGFALRRAIANMGILVTTIPEGFFGTPNAIAKAMVDNGIGFVGDLSTKLFDGGVVFNDIYNTAYTPIISDILKSITNTADLIIIQDTFKTSITDMASPMDYTIIERASGLINDSIFKTMADFGRDIYERAPNIQVETGADLVELIDSVQSDISPNVEALTGNVNADGTTPMLSQTIIDSLRTYLPVGDNKGPISIINVIGSASGYLIDGLRAVNDGIAQLYASDYGPQIRDALTEISRYNSKYALTEAEVLAAEKWVRVPPPTVIGFDANNSPIITQGPDYWETKLEEKKKNYFDLLDTIAADTSGNYPAIVQQINENWNWCCRNIYFEWKNYNKANLTVSSFSDNSQYLSFVSSLPQYGADVQNIGTDYLLYQICQPNEAGDTIKAVLGQGKTNQLLGEAGVVTKNVV